MPISFLVIFSSIKKSSYIFAYEILSAGVRISMMHDDNLF